MLVLTFRKNYSGVADGSDVTKAPYVSLDITEKEAVEKIISRNQSGCRDPLCCMDSSGSGGG